MAGRIRRSPDFNYFAATEQDFQRQFRSRRDRLSAPVVRICRLLGLSADGVTLAGMALLIPFGVLLFSEAAWAPVVATCLLWAHVVVDVFDGAVARAEGSDGAAGSLTDMCADHGGLLIVITLLAAAGLLDGTVATAYAGAYTVSVAFIIALNVVGQPLQFAIRTKYLVYGLYSLLALTGINWLTDAIIGFTGIHIAFAAIGFARFRSVLKNG